MTPREAYDDIAGRARYLLRLHDGLVNRRAYSIRSDWRAKFCKLMHWTDSDEIDRVDSKDAVLVLREGAELSTDDFGATALEELLRSAVALGMSAFDRYLHERIVKVIVRGLKRKKNLTREQRDLTLPTIATIRIIQRMTRARRLGEKFRAANEVRKALQEALHEKPLQKWRDLDWACKVMRVSNWHDQLKTAYGNPADLKAQERGLNDLAKRRNAIVHEGDLLRKQRGGQVDRRIMDRKFAGDALDFLDTLVGKLDRVS